MDESSGLGGLLRKDLGPPLQRIRGLLLDPLLPKIKRRWLGRVVVALACAASAALFVWMGFVWSLLAIAMPSFSGACARLRESGVGVTQADWFCHLLSPATILMRQSAYSLLIAVGFAIACMILVATGRRASAFLPLVGVVGMFDRGLYAEGGLANNALAILLTAIPALVMLAVLDIPRRKRIQARRLMMFAAACACFVVACVARFLVLRVLYHPWADPTFVRDFFLGDFSYVGLFIASPMTMVLFGAMLGSARKWWPWSLVVIAVLLSAGPTASFPLGVWAPGNPFFVFGATVPLFIWAFAFSGWGSLAEHLTRWRSKEEASPVSAAKPARSPRRLRPIVVANALGVSILVISVIASKNDTMGIYIAMPLPTYLGERIHAQDLRTKLDLRQALTDMDAYYATHGTYRGFNAKLGAKTDPSLAWHQGTFPATTDGQSSSPPSLTMAIVASSASLARVAALSKSGNAFCVQSVKHEGITYGKNEPTGSGTEAVDSAIANCASTPWTNLAVHPLAPLGCDNMTPESILCRMVEALIHNTMLTTNPNSPWPPSASAS